jgi:hypothetical protein
MVSIEAIGASDAGVVESAREPLLEYRKFLRGTGEHAGFNYVRRPA